MRSTKMSGSVSDHAGELLSALACQLAADPGELGVKALRVWRARSPEVVGLSEGNGEDLVTISADFMAILLGSLRTDIELDWTGCEQRARDYGRRRAVNGVTLESLIDELSVYRRTAIELISAALQDSPLLEQIVAQAHSRLEDVTAHLNQSMTGGYLDRVEAEHLTGVRRTRHLPAFATAVGRRACDAVTTVGLSLRKTFTAPRLRSSALFLKEKTVRLAGKAGRVVRSRPAYIEI